MAVLSIVDEALDEAPRAVERRPWTAGCRWCPGRCGGCTRSGRQLVVRAEADLDLVDRAGRRRGGCRCGFVQPAAQLASASLRVASAPMRAWRCWNTTRSGPEVLEAGHASWAPSPSRTSWSPTGATGPLALPRVGVPLLQDRCLGTFPRRSASGRRARPAVPRYQRSTMGRSTRTPSGTWTTIPGVHAARASSANASSTGRSGAPSMAGAPAARRSRRAPERDQKQASVSGPAHRAGGDRVLPHLEVARDPVRRSPSLDPRDTRGGGGPSMSAARRSRYCV